MRLQIRHQGMLEYLALNIEHYFQIKQPNRFELKIANSDTRSATSCCSLHLPPDLQCISHIICFCDFVLHFTIPALHFFSTPLFNSSSLIYLAFKQIRHDKETLNRHSQTILSTLVPPGFPPYRKPVFFFSAYLLSLQLVLFPSLFQF